MKTMNTMKTELIDYFKVGIKTNDSIKPVDFNIINKMSVKLGWIIHPDCCNELTLNWLNTLTTDYNATFYKEWSDVISKNRFELFIDQILHYSTTYGSNYECEKNGYVPNSGSIQPAFNNLKVLTAISEYEMYEECRDLVYSGIAINTHTLSVICGFITDCIKSNNLIYTIDVNSIKNREGLCIIASELNRFPNDEFGMLRCILYKTIGITSIIKDRKTINMIKSESYKFDFSNLTINQLTRLSRIFYRFKPIFLAFKSNKNNTRSINKIRRLAKTNHTPLKVGFWESVISTFHTNDEIINHIKDIDNFKKVRIMESVKIALLDEQNKIYNIRNGKSYVRCDYSPRYDKVYLKSLYNLIRKSLVNSLRAKSCRIKLPSDIEIKLPSSEKSYIGNYPIGTTFNLTKNNVIGIYWRNEWGTRDFDLSVTDIYGNHFGWNAYYGNINNNIIYSGDMTNANPCATELVYIKDTCDDAIVRVNQYNGSTSPKFRLFVANEQINVANMRNYMVDQNNIKLDTMIEADNRQTTVGFIHNSKFVLSNRITGNSIVASRNEFDQKYIETILGRYDTFIDMTDILIDAGFEIVNEDPDIDFTDIKKNTIIELMS